MELLTCCRMAALPSPSQRGGGTAAAVGEVSYAKGMKTMLHEKARNPKHTERARELRKDMTPQEKELWYKFLRRYPVQFRRQVTFGRFIVDFYCAKAKLVIELDGGQHFVGNGPAYDAERTAYLEGLGLRVLRFANNEVDREFRAVCEAIDRAVAEHVSPYSEK